MSKWRGLRGLVLRSISVVVCGFGRVPRGPPKSPPPAPMPTRPSRRCGCMDRRRVATILPTVDSAVLLAGTIVYLRAFWYYIVYLRVFWYYTVYLRAFWYYIVYSRAFCTF